MDQTKLRKNCASLKQTAPSETLSSAQKPYSNKKSRHKRNTCQTNYQIPYDTGFAPYAFNVPLQTRIHPSAQRLYQTTDASICHYPVPMSFPLEHVSLPFYSTLLQTGTAPLDKVLRINRTSEQKIPSIFQTVKQNNDIEQDYTSLPPVNFQLNPKQSKEDGSACKRRFSDPGLGQISSDECSESRSEESSNNSSLQDLHMPFACGLIDQVNELRENNSDLTKELHKIKLELESLKLLSASWKPYSEELQPGKLSDSIIEVRDAMKLKEEAIMTKITNLFDKNSSECSEAHRSLEERIMEKLNNRLCKLEEEMRKMTDGVVKSPRDEPPKYEGGAPAADIFLIQQQLVDSEQEKLSLRKELQEAIDSRKEAEAQTLKLERLVRVLRNKINGISAESSIPEEKPSAVRPLTASFEQNPFIIANNINNQKNHYHQQQQQKRTRKGEKEDGAANDGESSSSEGGTIPQVTITGPVTDL